MNRPFAGRSMIMELATRDPFRLGGATIDPVSREARWDGGEERLQPQTLKVLTALAAKRGNVVTREELIELCWDGRIVGDDVINRSISVLRHFADRAGGFAIQTVPKAGYRLIEHDQLGAAGRRRRIALAGTVLLTAVVAGIGLNHRTVAPKSPSLTVAILPFAADQGDAASRRFAAQVEDSSIRILTESGVSVAITKNRNELPKRPPDFVLSGAIAGSGDRTVATIRLEDPLRNAIVLSRQIQAEAGNPGALPDQVGAQLSAALSWVAPLLSLDRAHPSEPAFIAKLLSTNLSNFDSQRAFQFARRAAPSAPDSAIAQLALAMSTGMNLVETPPAERAVALAAGQAAAARALRLAPDFGDSYIPWCMLHAEVRLAECEASLRKGSAVDPRAPFVGSVLGHLLLNVGRIDEAVPVATEVLAKDAYVPGKITGLLIALETAGQAEDADPVFKRGRRLWPHLPSLFWKRVSGMTARGDFDALASFETEMGVEDLPPHYESVAALAHAIRAHSLPQARASCPDTAGGLKTMQCMLALARLGDLDAAFKLADRLYPRRTGGTAAEEEAIWISDPDNLDTLYLTASGAAPMRRDVRFLALADRLGLVRYWRSNRLPDFCIRDHEPICRQIAGRRT